MASSCCLSEVPRGLCVCVGGFFSYKAAGLHRRHATASWAYLFRMIKLLFSCCDRGSIFI